MLTAGELAAMRAVQGLALPGSAVILRRTMTPDGMGGQSEGWPAAGTVAARLASQNSRAVAESGVNGAQLVATTRWYVTMPVGTVVTAADRLVVGGQLFEILEVNNGQDWKTAVRCAVEKMNEEEAG